MSDLDYTSALQAGLTPFVPKDAASGYAEVRNSLTLAQCRNAHPTPNGAKPLRQMTYISSNLTQTAAWPHEQFMRLDKTFLHLRATSVFEMNRSTRVSGRVSAGVAEPLYDPTNNATSRTIPSNTNVWQGAGFQHNYFLTNGVAFVYKIRSAANESDGEPKILCATDAANDITVNMVGQHQNRLVLGGVQGSILSDSDFLDLFDYWRDNTPINVTIDEDSAFDASWLFIGPPGGGDTDIPFVVPMAIFNLIESAKRDRYLGIARTMIEEGLIHFIPMKHGTIVEAGHEYGNDFLAFTDNHVARMQLTQDGSYLEDVVLEHGICGRGAVAGTNSKVLFVDNQGLAHRFILNSGFETLGFERDLSNLSLDDDTLVVYDSADDFFWIGDGSDGYCLTPNGLGRNDALIPSSLVRLDNGDVLYGTWVAQSDPQPMVIETETYDGGPGFDRQTWEVGYVNLGTTDTNSTGWSVQQKSRLNKGDSFTSFNERASDNRGRHRMKCTGVEQRTVCTNPNYKEADLDHLSMTIGRGKISLRDWHDS